MNDKKGNILIFLAILISIGALILSWLAYSKVRTISGADIQKQTKTIKNQVLTQLHQEIAMSSARANLQAMQTQLTNNGQNYTKTQAAQNVATMKDNLKQVFGTASGQAKDTWQAVDGDMGTLEDQLKNNNQDYTKTLQKLVGEMNLNFNE
jgi:hypothetical protein